MSLAGSLHSWPKCQAGGRSPAARAMAKSGSKRRQATRRQVPEAEAAAAGEGDAKAERAVSPFDEATSAVVDAVARACASLAGLAGRVEACGEDYEAALEKMDVDGEAAHEPEPESLLDETDVVEDARPEGAVEAAVSQACLAIERLPDHAALFVSAGVDAPTTAPSARPVGRVQSSVRVIEARLRLSPSEPLLQSATDAAASGLTTGANETELEEHEEGSCCEFFDLEEQDLRAADALAEVLADSKEPLELASDLLLSGEEEEDQSQAFHEELAQHEEAQQTQQAEHDEEAQAQREEDRSSDKTAAEDAPTGAQASDPAGLLLPPAVAEPAGPTASDEPLAGDGHDSAATSETQQGAPAQEEALETQRAEEGPIARAFWADQEFEAFHPASDSTPAAQADHCDDDGSSAESEPWTAPTPCDAAPGRIKKSRGQRRRLAQKRIAGVIRPSSSEQSLEARLALARAKREATEVALEQARTEKAQAQLVVATEEKGRNEIDTETGLLERLLVVHRLRSHTDLSRALVRFEEQVLGRLDLAVGIKRGDSPSLHEKAVAGLSSRVDACFKADDGELEERVSEVLNYVAKSIRVTAM